MRWLIERCLAKDPAERYASTLDLARELRNVREHLPEVDSSGSSPRPGAPHAPPPTGAARRGVGAAALAVLALAWGRDEALEAPARRPARPAPVVAVLPVTNLPASPSTTPRRSGIAEVVVAGLAGIDGIQVLSRLATAGYRDRKGDLPRHRPRARRELPARRRPAALASSTCG